MGNNSHEISTFAEAQTGLLRVCQKSRSFFEVKVAVIHKNTTQFGNVAVFGEIANFIREKMTQHRKTALAKRNNVHIDPLQHELRDT